MQNLKMRAKFSNNNAFTEWLLKLCFYYLSSMPKRAAQPSVQNTPQVKSPINSGN